MRTQARASDQASDQESEHSDGDTIINTQGVDLHSVRRSSFSDEEELLKTVDLTDVVVLGRLDSFSPVPQDALPDALVELEFTGRSMSTC